MELTERKKRILKLVVENYIRDAEPVGSKTLAAQLEGGISSATIRNELADLTELGYLEQPHTSAGRIPSPKGYRLYVNELMEQKPLSAQETESLNAALPLKMQELDRTMSQAGQALSSLVNYPAYAGTAGKHCPTIRHYELLPVSAQEFITVLMGEDNRVKSKLCQSALPFAADGLGDLTRLLNAHFVGLPVGEMNHQLMEMTDQLPSEWFLVLAQVVEYASATLEQAGRKEVFTAGTSQLFHIPEYRDTEKAQDLISVLSEDKDALPVPEDGAAMQILIGPENVSEALKNSSVVVASYDIGDHMRGLIGVVGPLRMDYATVAARLSYFAESLTKMFGKQELSPKEEEQ